MNINHYLKALYCQQLDSNYHKQQSYGKI